MKKTENKKVEKKKSIELVSKLVEISKKQEMEARLEFNNKMGSPKTEMLQQTSPGEYKTFGIWEVIEGIVMVQKDKKGYNPSKCQLLSTELIEVIKNL